ncbi:ion transporter [Campylobacter devanensis]|nr:ion transporter [Campylobacter sp. P146]
MGIVRPVMEVYPYAWIVFVSYIVIVGMIALNLIVGVIVNSLNELNK